MPCHQARCGPALTRRSGHRHAVSPCPALRVAAAFIIFNLGRPGAAMALPPEANGLGIGIDALRAPPRLFIANSVKRAVMGEAERDRPFVRDLVAHGAQLGEAQVIAPIRHPRRPCDRVTLTDFRFPCSPLPNSLFGSQHFPVPASADRSTSHQKTHIAEPFSP